MTVQRIKEYQGYDAQTNSNFTYWKVFFLDADNNLQTKIITDKQELDMWRAL
jgi:hypothetical protein